MVRLLDQALGVLSQPPLSRSNDDLKAILPWLKQSSMLLTMLDEESALEILRYCILEMAEHNDVIIRQGEKGYCMYTILRGAVSVYIDTVMTGEEPDVSKPIQKSHEISEQQDTDRVVYGKFIVQYEAGKYFGEAALVDENNIRNATVIADKHCHLLVIDQVLFNKYLREILENQFRAVEKFVDTHAFFSNMSSKFKRLLQLSLHYENFAFNTPIITQGDRHTALFFIISGQASIYMDPCQHQTQYNHLWPFEVGIDIYSQEFEWLRESRKNAIVRKFEKPPLLKLKPEKLAVRRRKGYAASERLLHERQICLCSVREGEVLGDTEVVSNLSTYMQTAICNTYTRVLVLDTKNLERLTGRRNPVTMQRMLDHVRSKLDMRLKSKYGQQIPLLTFLYAKLTEERPPDIKKLPPITTAKVLPPIDTQRQHLLKRYLCNKAELVEPYVPGALIYKDLQEEKARIRANIRRRGSIGMNSALRSVRRDLAKRKVRSRRQLMQSLKEMQDTEFKEANLAPLGKMKTLSSLTTVTGNLKSPLPVTSPTKPGNLLDTHTREKDLDGNEQKMNPLEQKKRVTFVYIENGEKQNEEEIDRSRHPLISSSNSQVEATLSAPLSASSSKLVAAQASLLPDILEEKEGTLLMPSLATPPQSTVFAHNHYSKREVPATRDGSTKRLPPLAKVENERPSHLPSERWHTAVRLINEHTPDHASTQLISDEDTTKYQDYESSERSLQLLETRIKRFHLKQVEAKPTKLSLKLPKLRRFKIDADENVRELPKRGGKVWIKKRLCQFANSTLKVNGHQHIRYKIVPELPEFDKVKTLQHVMHRLLASHDRITQPEEPPELYPDLSQNRTWFVSE